MSLNACNLKRSCNKPWNSTVAREAREFVKVPLADQLRKLKCRSDVRTYCHKYDNTILPTSRRQLDIAMGRLRGLQAN